MDSTAALFPVLHGCTWHLKSGTIRFPPAIFFGRPGESPGAIAMSQLTISGKSLGARKPLFADWSIPFPPEWSGEGGLTLRRLISRVVRLELAAFRQRQQERLVLRALTARQIVAAAERGKIEMGASDVAPQPVDDDEAVAVACQAFEDGLYLVVIDGHQQRDLDRQIYLQPDSHITFVRLTMLAGG
jgi:hypothetical protein